MSLEHFDWQRSRFIEAVDAPAMVWHDEVITNGELLSLWEQSRKRFASDGIGAGDVVGILGDFSPAAVAGLLALAELGTVVVPLAHGSIDQHERFFGIAQVERLVVVDDDDRFEVSTVGRRGNHPLLERLRADDDAGLILFSSGSTGEPKAILHALSPLLRKFRKLRRAYRTISFLLFDHIGGVNTLFYTLANLGCTIVPRARTVTAVCEAIQAHRAELLPTSPSFINLLLFADAPSHYDLSSLRLITYGTEVMPEHTLERAAAAFPNAKLHQTYGLSELGILRSKSEATDSLFVKVGGEDYQTRISNGTLQIRAKTSMIGYLNADNPFDAEGWFDTGDVVEQKGDYYRIRGRESDIVNVGGQKVFPAEVERVIGELPGVIDVVVMGEPHLLLGQVVVAVVQTTEPRSAIELKREIGKIARGRLQPYMVPAKVRVVEDSPVSYRYKKIRR